MSDVKEVKLKDNRVISYMEFGDPNGTPMFLFHGWPTSALAGSPNHQAALKTHIRLICPERPGYGASTLKPERTMLDWANDVAEIAEQLGFTTFSVLGVSGGGPYALACAYKLPHLISKAYIVCSILNLNDLRTHQIQTAGLLRILLSMSKNSKTFVKVTLHTLKLLVDKSNSMAFSLIDKKIPERDHLALGGINAPQNFNENIKRGLSQGIVGAEQDIKIYTNDWGFDLADIKIPIAVWHGTHDTLTPTSFAQYLHNKIPHSTLNIIEGEGHFIAINQFEKIVSS